MFDLLGSLIAFFFQITHSYGMAIVMLTIAVRLLLFPLTAKQTRSMQAMARVQPQVKKLQAQYKDDRQKLNEELMKFYKQEKINPAAGCLPLLLQMPVFFALYRIIRGLTHTGTLGWLQIRVPQPDHIAHTSEMYKAIVRGGGRLVSWTIDLAQTPAGYAGPASKRIPYIVLVVLVAVTGILQQQLANMRNPQPATGQAAQMQTFMKIMPIFLAVISYNMQAGLVLYWIAGNIWTIAQQELLFRTTPLHHRPGYKGDDDGVIEAPSKEKGAKAKAADDAPGSAKPARGKGAGAATPTRSANPRGGRPGAGDAKGDRDPKAERGRPSVTKPADRGPASKSKKKGR